MSDLMAFPCPKCNAPLRAPYESAGRSGTCGKCKATFIVPAQFAMDTPQKLTPVRAGAAPAAPANINPFERLPPPPKPKPGVADRIRPLVPLAIGAVVLGTIGMVAWSYVGEEKAPQPPTGNEVSSEAPSTTEKPRPNADKADVDRQQAAERTKLAADKTVKAAKTASVDTTATVATPASPSPTSQAQSPAVAAPVVQASKPVAPAPVSMAKKEAEQLVAAGRIAMQESNDTPSRSVAAAVSFSKAIAYYAAAGDVDMVCDLEANIFWCKKRMNVDDVKAFLAAKAGDHSVAEALAKADEVALKDIPKSEAKNYLERADKFAQEHADDFEQISVRYFEVAERFVGTDISVQAQKLSLDAQHKQMKLIQAEKDAQRQTLFTRSAASATAAGQRAAVPAPDALKTAVAAVRKLYKDDYAKTKPNQKRRLVAKLLEQVAASKDDPVSQYALLSESLDIAQGVGDWYSIFTTCDLMAQYFTGIDATAKKKEVYGKSHGTPTVQAIVKLLDAPEDADANAVVGKYFCFDAGKWDIGLPLLAHGSDADYKAAAEMELLRPAAGPQQVELADKWYELGKKAHPGARDTMLARAFSWYKEAEGSTTGITKQRIAQRIDEIDDLLPMTNLDYDNLTPKQWDHLKGVQVEVSAGKDRNDIGISIVHGQRVRVVPHPTDTWTSDYFNTPVTVTWKGYQASRGGTITLYYGYGEFPIGALLMQIESGKQSRPGIIEGEGRIFLGPYVAGWGSGGNGKIRCKIMAVTDDDADSGIEAAKSGGGLGAATGPGGGAGPATGGAALGGDPTRIILGKWDRNTGAIFIFRKDGDGTNGKTPISWHYDGQRFMVTYPEHPGWLDQVILLDKTHAKCITTNNERVEDLVKVNE